MHRAEGWPQTVAVKVDSENYQLADGSESLLVFAPLLIVMVVAVITGGIGIMSLGCIGTCKNP
ncbi:MAG: hypothetical protein ACLP5V_16035 [Candidatus Bathyarchaeia archaeon]